ncbi:NTP/NDP exchange transporter [Aquimarina brevivitae]|uniref:ADP,ATP carrier protein n=1 Tax=Aquimarina brevivitae TaxID=323412 RepID=A0A4Q7NXQ7_9FLAO|nr:Npt1/Npt2 family nucleotide transporter [Aquimarina brevivitae]RZS92017.1 AAA family ATP:ADP antiporter [Aquimarina brevivitae]
MRLKSARFVRDKIQFLFDIKEEEFKKTVLLQLSLFLVISALLIIKPSISSLFLSELGSDALPLGYVLTAIAAMIGSYFYTLSLNKNALDKIIEITLYGSIALLIIFGISFKTGIAKGALLYIPYVWIAIFGLLVASQFWVLANLVYNIREAKRIFGYIGSGAIAGGIFGGYVTSILTRYIATEDLLFVAAFLLLPTLPILKYIWKHEVHKNNAFLLSKRTETTHDNPFQIIRKSKLLSQIAIVTGISVLIAKLVDFQYSDYASRTIEDPEMLASFFGFWFSTLSILSLLVQLFLTKRIVGKFGVGKSLLWLPVGILLGSTVFLLFPQLWVIVFIKVVDGSLKQSINKAATELLAIPVPIEIKKKTKTFIDVVVDSFATGLAGLSLIFLINGLELNEVYISIVIVLLSLVWIYGILQLKKEYLNAFKRLFISHDDKPQKNKTDIPITSIVDSVKKVLIQGSDAQIIFMLKKILEVKDDRFFEELIFLLGHLSPQIRALAIENLYFLSSKNSYNNVETLIYDPDQKVTTNAFRYLIKFHQGDKIELFNTYLNSEDHTIANACLLGLSLEVRNHPKLQQFFNIEKKITTLITSLDEETNEIFKKHKILTLLEAVGNANLAPFYHFIENYIHHSDYEILNKALFAASKTLDPRFIDTIIANLSKKQTKKIAQEALYNYGEKIIDVLVAKVVHKTIPLDSARIIPSVIEKFGTKKVVKSLFTLIDNTEHEIKIEAMDALQRFKWKNTTIAIKDKLLISKILDECELYQNTLASIHTQIVIDYKKKATQTQSKEENLARLGLISLLENRLDRQLKRIFKYLGMKYPPDEIDSILEALLKGKEEQRIHAIEFLDNILNTQLKKELIPITEASIVNASYTDKVKLLDIKTLSELECYKLLLQRKDVKLKLAILYLIEHTKDKQFLPLIQPLTEDTNSIIQSRSQEVYEKILRA